MSVFAVTTVNDPLHFLSLRHTLFMLYTFALYLEGKESHMFCFNGNS